MGNSTYSGSLIQFYWTLSSIGNLRLAIVIVDGSGTHTSVGYNRSFYCPPVCPNDSYGAGDADITRWQSALSSGGKQVLFYQSPFPEFWCWATDDDKGDIQSSVRIEFHCGDTGNKFILKVATLFSNSVLSVAKAFSTEDVCVYGSTCSLNSL